MFAYISYLRYSFRVLQIRFEKLLKEKLPGERSTLEEAARAASSSLPYLLSFVRLKKEEVVHEMEALTVRDLDLHQSEGMAYSWQLVKRYYYHIKAPVNINLMNYACPAIQRG